MQSVCTCVCDCWRVQRGPLRRSWCRHSDAPVVSCSSNSSCVGPTRFGDENNEKRPNASAMITVVTATSNPVPEYIDATAASLFAQTYDLFEWVLVDDHSRNHSVLNTYRHHPDTRIHVTSCLGLSAVSQQCGLPRARNFGLKFVRTPYVLFLDDDDFLDPTYLEKLLWLLQCHIEFDYANTFTAAFGAKTYKWTRKMTDSSAMENAQTATALIRTSALSSLAGWPAILDESLVHGSEDWDMWLNLKSSGFHGVTIPEYLFHYRIKQHRRKWGFLQKSTAGGQQSIEDESVRRSRYPRLFMEGGHKNPSLPAPPLSNLCLSIMANSVPVRDHVLLIVPWLALGGAGRVAEILLRALVELGFHASVITTLSTNVISSTTSDLDALRSEMQKYTKDIFTLPHFLSVSSYLNFIVHIARTRGSRAVVISNSEAAYNLLPFMRAELPDVLILDYVHMRQPEWIVPAFFESACGAGGYPRLSAVFSKYIDKSLYVSLNEMQHARKTWNLDGGHKQRVVYVGIPEPEPQRDLEQWGTASGAVRVLFVGRLTEQKRPLMVVSLLTGLDVLLVVAGDGPLRAPMDRACLETGVKAVFLGEVAENAMSKVYASCDMLLMPSAMEGLSVAAIEASMHGLPVVTTDVGGQSEIVPAETGLLFAVNDSVGMRNCVQRLVASASDRRASGSRGAKFARNRFGLNEFRRTIAHILQTTKVRPREAQTEYELEAAVAWLHHRNSEHSFEAMYLKATKQWEWSTKLGRELAMACGDSDDYMRKWISQMEGAQNCTGRPIPDGLSRQCGQWCIFAKHGFAVWLFDGSCFDVSHDKEHMCHTRWGELREKYQAF